MTQTFKSKEEIEGNLTIAKFMGVENVSVHQTFGVYKAQDEYGYIDWVDVGIITLDYHKDWNLLMSVIEKISMIPTKETNEGLSNLIYSALNTINIKDTHWAVVEFIKWFNIEAKKIG